MSFASSVDQSDSGKPKAESRGTGSATTLSNKNTSERTQIQRLSAKDEVDGIELRYQKRKVAIHEKLVDSLDLSMLAEIRQEELEEEVRFVAGELLKEESPDIQGKELDRMLSELSDEVFGLGPLEALMKDDEVSDILVNNCHEVYVERHGCLTRSNVLFADEQHLMRIIQRVVSRVGRRIDEVSPMVDARLPDGSRVNAVIPPLALDGPSLSIRRFGTRPLEADDLLGNGTMIEPMLQFLEAAVEARVSFLISGGTGSGKTTLLNALTTYIPADERLVSIEDSAELKMLHKHVVRMETRPANTEDTGEITQRSLLRNSLRMRPDRIIIGEVRGAEALDMLQAMNTGHEGSLTTIHANDALDALTRLELMVAMSGYELPIPVVRQYISTGISLVVHLARLRGGVRRLMKVSEIVGMRDGSLELQEIFGFEQTSVNDMGIAQGEFYVTGHRPQCLTRLRAAGIRLPDELFDKRRVPERI